MSWRKLTRSIHRDLGYTAAALVVAYSLSGLAVNHIDDWNPNFTFEREAISVGPLPAGDLDAMEAHVVTRLALDPADVRGRVMDSPTAFRIFLPEGAEVRVDTTTGDGSLDRVNQRFFLYQANLLHLNAIKGVWTWVADLFAIVLCTLAVTGLLMNQGRLGVAGRGKWFLAVGLLIPAIFLLYACHGADLGSGHGS